jgi:hypothetical protein
MSQFDCGFILILLLLLKIISPLCKEDHCLKTGRSEKMKKKKKTTNLDVHEQSPDHWVSGN